LIIVLRIESVHVPGKNRATLYRLCKVDPKTNQLVVHDWISDKKACDYVGSNINCVWDASGTTLAPSSSDGSGAIRKFKVVT
jgi:hypothetical protein